MSWHDDLAKAGGLDPLRLTDVPAGERELRIVYSSGSRTAMLQLVDGDSVRGQCVLHYADTRTAPPCARPRAKRTDPCRRKFRKEPSWKEVLDRIDRLDMHELAAGAAYPGESPSVVAVDGGALWVERRTARRYQAFKLEVTPPHLQPQGKAEELNALVFETCVAAE